MIVISCDQGATKITGYFIWFGGCAYDFRTCEDENWICHVESAERLIKEIKPSLFLFEDVKQYAGNSKGFVNYHFRNVVKAGGAVEYVCHQLGVSKYGIVNAHEWRTQEKAKRGMTPGLIRKKEWYFKDRKITVHEKDALVLFYVWCERNKKPWPWY